MYKRKQKLLVKSNNIFWEKLMHILKHVLIWHHSHEFSVYVKHNCEKHEASEEVIYSVEPCPSTRSH